MWAWSSLECTRTRHTIYQWTIRGVYFDCHFENFLIPSSYFELNNNYIILHNFNLANRDCNSLRIPYRLEKCYYYLIFRLNFILQSIRTFRYYFYYLEHLIIVKIGTYFEIYNLNLGIRIKLTSLWNNTDIRRFLIGFIGEMFFHRIVSFNVGFLLKWTFKKWIVFISIDL